MADLSHFRDYYYYCNSHYGKFVNWCILELTKDTKSNEKQNFKYFMIFRDSPTPINKYDRFHGFLEPSVKYSKFMGKIADTASRTPSLHFSQSKSLRKSIHDIRLESKYRALLGRQKFTRNIHPQLEKENESRVEGHPSLERQKFARIR